MRTIYILTSVSILLYAGCYGQQEAISPTSRPLYSNVTTTRLPYQDLQQLSMDAGIADFDKDGDLDILIANEHRPNILLINDGTGKFTNDSTKRIPQVAHDSEEIGIADFDLDGDLDIIIVSEDDKINEFYLNTGDGFFEDAGNRIPVTGTSNSVVVIDINNDKAPDIIIGNNGQNKLLINTGTGTFKDEATARLGDFKDATQDLTLGDIDNDGDLDLLIANEDANRILINDGNGFFKNESAKRLPYRTELEETREVVVADIDADGDLDILYGNVQAFVPNALRQNRLLINNGTGVFTDVTATHLPKDDNSCFSVAFVDIDGDGDPDIITGNTDGPRFDVSSPFSVYLNNSEGIFTAATDAILPKEIVGRGFDIDFADVNKDGIKDLFLSNRGSQDFLLLGNK